MDHTVNGNITSHQVQLSPFDQTIPRLYVHKLFIFPFPKPDRQSEAVERLEQALSATMLRWQFIIGDVIPAEDTEKQNEVRLRYNTPTVGGVDHDVLVVKNLSALEFPWTYQALVDAGMPPSAMKKEVLSNVPEWPELGKIHPALAIQANFIDGGLILCFAFHHTVADGGTFCTFLKSFAQAMKNPPTQVSAVQMAVEKRLNYATAPEMDIAALHGFPEYDFNHTPARAKSPGAITTRILTFTAAKVQMLEEAIKEHLKQTPGGEPWVSNIACLSGLIWVAVVRARQARLDLSDIVKIGIAVNIRSVIEPKLSEDYFGNALVHVIATAKVSEFVADRITNTGKDDGGISIATLALAASRMRRAVSSVDKTYVNERLKTFSAMEDPTETSRAYTRAMDTSHTGLDFSSWRDQGADVEFGIPGAGTSSVAWWRKTWSPNEGAYNILPRKGGGKGPADWEVSLGLSAEDMERVCSEGELGGWFSRYVE